MSEWLRPLLSIALVLGLLVALRWWLGGRRLSPGGGRAARRTRGHRLESLERLCLTPQHTLHLVRVEDRTVLIGAHAGGLSVLQTLPARAVEAEGSGCREASR